MKKSARPQRIVMHQRDVPHRRPNARPQNSQPVKSHRLQPAQTPPRILHRLLVRLERQPNIRPDKLIRALVPLRHAPIVIRQAQPQHAYANPLQPFAQPALPMPLRIPVRQQNHRRPQAALVCIFIAVSVRRPVRCNTRSTPPRPTVVPMRAVPAARHMPRSSLCPRRKKLRMYRIVLRPRRLEPNS